MTEEEIGKPPVLDTLTEMIHGFADEELPEVEFNDFDIWRCFRPYAQLDRIFAKHPDGVIIRRRHRGAVKFKPGILIGPGMQYTNLHGTWHAEQQLPDTPEQRARGLKRANELLDKINSRN